MAIFKCYARLVSSAVVLVALIVSLPPSLVSVTLTSQLIASGLDAPLLLISPPGDTARLFIIEQGGRVRIHDGTQLLTTSFLDISSLIVCCQEEGLLGMAFHPQYESNGYFFVNYVSPGSGGKTVIRRYKISSNPNIANKDSSLIILEILQPFPNHNGGMIDFGPNDGYLYIGMGDGGSSGDPQMNGQNGKSLLGKMLRIDVNNTENGKNYSIPDTNPFVNTIDTLAEIWAFGLRNPWRWSFDSETGDMYIADVGQFEVEEINFQPQESTGGENYGWRLKEGTSCFMPTTGCDTLSYVTDPITQYFHASSRCSITGGFIYRGCAIPNLTGTYFYADWCSKEIWSFRYDGNNILDSANRTSELGISVNVTSFGRDGRGELYVIGNGKVYKIIPAGQQEECAIPPCCNGRTGNIDNSLDDLIDISDLTFLIDHLFISFPELECPQAANIDGDLAMMVDISDLTFLIDHLFINFPSTANCI